MRKILIVIALFLSQIVNAQSDKRASNILNAMSNKYQALMSFKVSFTYTNEGQGAAKETLKGDAIVKGNKFRLKMAGQEIFNDGKIMTTYIKESNEATINNYDPKEIGDVDPTRIYTIYKKGYKYMFIEEVTESGRIYEVVELSPEKKDSKVAKVQIKVDKKDKSIKSWKVTQRNGQRMVFRVDQFSPNVKIEDKFFTFDASQYKGVEVIDLR